MYHDFLQARNLTSSVRRFTLIDPSERCLQRAALHVRRFFPHSEICTVCKYIDELTTDDLFSGNQSRTLHLLSNLPGMAVHTVECLADVMTTMSEGYHQFVCVGPYYGNSPERMTRLDTLIERMEIPLETVVAEDWGDEQFVPGQAWTCALRIFAKGGGDPKSETPSEAQPVSPVGSAEKQMKILDGASLDEYEQSSSMPAWRSVCGARGERLGRRTLTTNWQPRRPPS